MRNLRDHLIGRVEFTPDYRSRDAGAAKAAVLAHTVGAGRADLVHALTAAQSRITALEAENERLKARLAESVHLSTVGAIIIADS